jgi:MoaA/NifB/PqqE/SkfB family radical SAM enzyme
MPRLILELTNKCDLRCPHCFDERHAATGDASLALIDAILVDAKACGIDELVFTGGEPTIHRSFTEIGGRVAAAGFGIGVVTNGRRFDLVAAMAHRHRSQFRGVTFSLDGAREDTHDRSRGRGSFRRVMRAVTQCFFSRLPFTLNMVLTGQNCGEVEEMIDLATRTGSRGVRFGHLMFTPAHVPARLVLSPAERRAVEETIWSLSRTASVPVAMAAGYFSESPFFACGPLALEEYNVDYAGNLTLCCQLSGLAGLNAGNHVFGNLHQIGLRQAVGQFHAHVSSHLAAKRRVVEQGAFAYEDHFPCWYCVKHHQLVPEGAHIPGWTPASIPQRRLHVVNRPSES